MRVITKLSLIISATCFSSSLLFAQSANESMLPIGTVIMCESKASTGFDWSNGTYVLTTFKPQKRLFRKVPTKDCPMGIKFEDNDFSTDKQVHRSNDICIKHNYFGDPVDQYGDKCVEFIAGTKGKPLDHQIHCNAEIFTPFIKFSPNGIYHLANIHGNLSRKPEKKEKDSQYVEWGLCSVVSGN